MFTGIIKETGKINKISGSQQEKQLGIFCPAMANNIYVGDSIAVNGCCLTVKSLTGKGFITDVSGNTLSSTSFKDVKLNEVVNLEESLRMTDRLGGHFVTGHIDTVVNILEIKKSGNFYTLKMQLPEEFLKFLAEKGSIALDGVSLTILESKKSYFCVTVIPHTFENTNLRYKNPGSWLNMEIDLISRYIYQILEVSRINGLEKSADEKERILKEKLIDYGFWK